MTQNEPNTAAPIAESDAAPTETGFGGIASFADAETREILNLLNQSDGDGSGDAVGGCCGGGCCS